MERESEKKRQNRESKSESQRCVIKKEKNNDNSLKERERYVYADPRDKNTNYWSLNRHRLGVSVRFSLGKSRL